MRSAVWIYFNHYPADAVFSGGKPAVARIMSLVIYTLKVVLTGLSYKPDFRHSSYGSLTPPIGWRG